ncbi:GIY-YIG nuclease family protein [Ciceribacter ferrooxidans]|uniref:GIY-YIG nuclease family protein n=1 Tax=Ciceribacter ferrooxidans TaxID=2509717 RepID=UPI00315CD2D0
MTGGSVERRIAKARFDPTYLMADVEVVASYELYDVNRAKLESLIHKVFGAARLDVEIQDRFDQPIVPKEWILVPVFAIDEVVVHIKDGTITGNKLRPLPRDRHELPRLDRLEPVQQPSLQSPFLDERHEKPPIARQQEC